jgi:hypothetical protein
VDDNVDDTGLGFNKLSDRKQVRVTDAALEVLDADPGDLLIFEKTNDEDTVKISVHNPMDHLR